MDGSPTLVLILWVPFPFDAAYSPRQDEKQCSHKISKGAGNKKHWTIDIQNEPLKLSCGKFMSIISDIGNTHLFFLLLCSRLQRRRGSFHWYYRRGGGLHKRRVGGRGERYCRAFGGGPRRSKFWRWRWRRGRDELLERKWRRSRRSWTRITWSKPPIYFVSSVRYVFIRFKGLFYKHHWPFFNRHSVLFASILSIKVSLLMNNQYSIYIPRDIWIHTDVSSTWFHTLKTSIFLEALAQRSATSQALRLTCASYLAILWWCITQWSWGLRYITKKVR